MSESAMAARPARRRGEPVMVLAMLLGGWIGVRAMLWEGLPLPPAIPLELAIRQQLLADARVPPPALAPAPAEAAASRAAPAPAMPPAPPLTTPLAAPLEQPVPAQPLPAPPRLADAAGALQPPQQVLPPRLMRAPVASAHALLWMAAVSQMPLLEPMPAASPVPARTPALAAARVRRWSGDGWLMLRDGGQGFGPAGALPTYGASQLGAVLRYRLDSGRSGHRPMAYARVSGALSGPSGTLGERELALGLSARPFQAIPARIMVEARVSRFASGVTRVRPSASVVSELAPVTLPLATRAEFYAQAGYVGGPAATAFVDGQFRLDRQIARIGTAELRGGAGAWGGAQTGSGRLDVGPGLTLRANAGATSARLAMDWRFRVAGNAAPASGPALTLSAGF